MATSKIPGIWHHEPLVCAPIPARTPGIWGILDQGDVTIWTLSSDSGGSVGFEDHGQCTSGGMHEQALKAQRSIPSKGDAPATGKQNEEVLLLAAVAYGESSAKDVYEEMAGIASVLVRQSDDRDQELDVLLGPKGTFAFAASDGNPRTAAFRKASQHAREIDPGMELAIKAAHNALDDGKDYSNDAYFWDGADIKTNYANHPKVKLGIKFTDPKHNIYNIKESRVDVTTHWQVPGKDGKLVDGKERGSYTYVYESTAAWGGTIFWRYSDDYLKATGSAEYR